MNEANNRYFKYCRNVWVVETTKTYSRGDIIEVTTKREKINEHYVHNLVAQKNGLNYYSITRVDGTNTQTVAERKANKYLGWADSARVKAEEYHHKSNKDHNFLVLAEPIKIGHHSEKRHRKAIDNANRNTEKSVEMDNKMNLHLDKAEYWKGRTNDINLSMPESIEYFDAMLNEAKKHHLFLKENPEKREHSMSLQYAKKKVQDLAKKHELSVKLWGDET